MGKPTVGSNPTLSAMTGHSRVLFFILDKGGMCIMEVRLNEDKEMVKTIRDGLKRTGGYCPCRLERTEDNKCMCKEFREQIADPNFKGYCHCLLYYKD